ncbi:hypothetical protein JKF63_02268 [Porcisia hertigi]|uniref:PDZ GRASP-type domain-containing protein n=1 Tax=Porcisia hertigi TaxID=2761500 RepID=A0A836I7V9_9TRYP|nr:hypothetical protein JKF63_02268 [Porcisia hertigi]
MGQDNSCAEEGQPGKCATGSADRRSSISCASAPASGATVSLAGIEGFQVVRLLPYSPAHKAGLVPYFDIITALDHVLLNTEGKQALQFFKSYVANHRDTPVCFTMFNLYNRTYRDVYCIPSDEWGGVGLLGCSIEWSSAASCPERCLHIVDVLEGSPAACCRELKANRDYIVGMQMAQEPLVTVITLIKNQNDFYKRLESWHEEQRWMLERQQRFPSETIEVPHVLLLLVYNSENNTVKEVAVEMGTNPEAALGISVATGLLHIIPSVVTAGDSSAGASLPVMNKFVFLGPSAAMPIGASSSKEQALIGVHSTPPVGATLPPQERFKEPQDFLPQPPHSLPSEEVQEFGTVVPKTTNGMVHLQDSLVNLHPRPSPEQQQPPYPSAEAAPHAMLQPTSYSSVPLTQNGEARVPVPSAPASREQSSPLVSKVSTGDSALHCSTMAHEAAVVSDHQLGQHALRVEQPHDSLPPLSAPRPAPTPTSSVFSVNGYCAHGASPAPCTSGSLPQQPHSEDVPTFSVTRMPPPLQFPVFPRAAAARHTTV